MPCPLGAASFLRSGYRSELEEQKPSSVKPRPRSRWPFCNCRRSSLCPSCCDWSYGAPVIGLQLRAAIDPDGVTGDPACIVGGEEGDDTADVVRLGDALERLHAERRIAPCVRL